MVSHQISHGFSKLPNAFPVPQPLRRLHRPSQWPEVWGFPVSETRVALDLTILITYIYII